MDDKTNNAAYALRQVYQKHLLAYEEHNRGRLEDADATRCQPETASASEGRDDAEEAADILNAIMGLSAVPQLRAPPKKPSKAGRVRCCTSTFRQLKADKRVVRTSHT